MLCWDVGIDAYLTLRRSFKCTSGLLAREDMSLPIAQQPYCCNYWITEVPAITESTINLMIMLSDRSRPVILPVISPAKSYTVKFTPRSGRQGFPFFFSVRIPSSNIFQRLVLCPFPHLTRKRAPAPRKINMYGQRVGLKQLRRS